MYPIQQVTRDTAQSQILVLDDGSQIELTLVFRPMQYGWFIRDLVYKGFTVHNLRVCVSPNILHQYRNQLPFGIACLSIQNREPSQQSDFYSGNASLYLLSADEVIQYAEYLSGQTGA